MCLVLRVTLFFSYVYMQRCMPCLCIVTSQKIFHSGFLQCMRPKPQSPPDLVSFTEDIFHEKLPFFVQCVLFLTSTRFQKSSTCVLFQILDVNSYSLDKNTQLELRAAFFPGMCARPTSTYQLCHYAWLRINFSHQYLNSLFMDTVCIYLISLCLNGQFFSCSNNVLNQ